MKTTKHTRFSQPVPTKSSTPTTTLHPANLKKKKAEGFTLVEILIVLTIVSMVLALGLPAITQVVSQKLNSTSRRFVGIVRSVRNDAILLNSIHRIGFNFEDDTWWVEAQRKFEMLGASTEEKTEEQLKEEQSNFAVSPKYSEKPKPLPGGIEFGAIFKEREGLVEEGIVYLHFFPNGYNEPAVIYLTRTSNTEAGYAIEIQPTGGAVEVMPETLEEMRKLK